VEFFHVVTSKKCLQFVKKSGKVPASKKDDFPLSKMKRGFLILKKRKNIK